jgi:hypothetical protein
MRNADLVMVADVDVWFSTFGDGIPDAEISLGASCRIGSQFMLQLAECVMCIWYVRNSAVRHCWMLISQIILLHLLGDVSIVSSYRDQSFPQ